ncbi:hypothetical protein SAICODRAFT_26073 [Saitoella complicata NRRL Y-17804]|uniref:Uncharacterized protein n=1 Tax=Saitoella complicata (strain BCRC 22490 / CBS 7301 / JCM 7358 / NBRC 10748 / NRRL Y-17804) TaxID=698492 RepID=A0A0E9NCJ7_SAICN|nr:uncharacterized protein SAICODRAFT_26073 [Saitoella complicata NRRL Y-17804]ODQ52405.1 hypothetical protein SAICODRAFT_26073 [Saitoella complicata NRRL Y-17804]GAO47592.1 hypothetical protein G7K_1794-t1 [Saitoella complicata NRRL Y-17804]
MDTPVSKSLKRMHVATSTGITPSKSPRRLFSDISRSDPLEADVSQGTVASQLPHLEYEDALEEEKAMLLRQLRAIRAEMDGLKNELARVERDAEERNKDTGIDNLIAQLLTSNNATVSLPTPAPSPSSTTAIPSARPILESTQSLHNIQFVKFSSSVISTNRRKHEFAGHASSKTVWFSVAMTVNEENYSVLDLNIKMSPWARAEIGEYIDRCCEGGNVSNALYAIASYAHLAQRRLTVFNSVYDKLCDQKLVSANNDMMRPVLGTPILRIIGQPDIVLSWHIDADTRTGDARSSITADIRVPEAWERADNGKDTLRQFGGVFERLVDKRGFEKAAVAVVGVFGGAEEAVQGGTKE